VTSRAAIAPGVTVATPPAGPDERTAAAPRRIAILVTVLSLNILGDWVRDRLDSKLRQV
jgi:hypothetical protein